MTLTEQENKIINDFTKVGVLVSTDFIREKLREHSGIFVQLAYKRGFKDGEQCGYLESQNEERVYLNVPAESERKD